MTRLLKIAAIALLLVVAVYSAKYLYTRYEYANVEDGYDLGSSIDQRSEQYVAEGGCVGMVIGVVKQGRSYVKGYGSVSRTDSRKPDSLSLFELSSTGKLFTTLTLQILADEGMLHLDDDIQTILGGKVQLPNHARNITLRHLAAHRSGLPPMPRSFLQRSKDHGGQRVVATVDDIYDYLSTCDGKKASGTFVYSNFGMGLLGHLLELKMGRKYEELLQEKIFHPLAMEHTFIPVQKNYDGLVQGHSKVNEPMEIEIDTLFPGSGSFLTNASDMVKFLRANLNDAGSGITASLIRTHQQQYNGGLGLGWFLPTRIDRSVGNENMVWHNGMSDGFVSFIALDRSNGYGVVILANKAKDIEKFRLALMRTVRTQSWNACKEPATSVCQGYSADKLVDPIGR